MKGDEYTLYTPDELLWYETEKIRITKLMDEAKKQYRLTGRKQIGTIKEVLDEQEQQARRETVMPKMNFAEMEKWADTVGEFTDKVTYLKLPQGIHAMRILPIGNDPKYNNGFESYFRVYTLHTWGNGKNFRSALCWDYVMDNAKGIRQALIDKEKISQEDAVKAKKHGCPVCTTLDVLINQAHLDDSKVKEMLRTVQRCLLNVFYLYQVYPPKPSDATPRVGNAIWEISTAMNKKIIQAMAKDGRIEQLDSDEIGELISIESGKMLVVQAEGEGIGKNKREYSVDFKGKRSQLRFLPNPYNKDGKQDYLEFDESYEVYNLVDVECEKLMGYQQMIDVTKSLFGRLLDQMGYEIPADEPSSNPLDDNYKPDEFVDRMMARPKEDREAIKKALSNERTFEPKLKKSSKSADDEEPVAPLKNQKKKAVKEDDNEDWLNELVGDFEDKNGDFKSSSSNAFEMMVPPSEEEEIITPVKKKRKIF